MVQHRLQIHKEAFSFSAGHFTIFSATERETMHGHNYYVSVSFDILVEHNGLSFDYRLYKKKLQALCETVDRHFLLPQFSPYLTLDLESSDDYYYAYFNSKKLFFLKEDVVILPLSNITIESLSSWFLSQLIDHAEELQKHAILDIQVDVFNGLEQSGSSRLSHLTLAGKT